jgi:hypothetical protein
VVVGLQVGHCGCNGLEGLVRCSGVGVVRGRMVLRYVDTLPDPIAGIGETLVHAGSSPSLLEGKMKP